MTNTWMVRAGRNGYVAENFAANGCVAIGWRDLGDLSNVVSREELGALHDRAYPDRSRVQRGITLGQIARFIFELAEGDNLVTYDSEKREYLVGRVAGPYRYQPELVPDHPNVRDAEWLGLVSRDDLTVKSRNRLGSASTLFKIHDSVWTEIQGILKGESPTVEETEEEDDLDAIQADVVDRAHEFIKDKVKALAWDDMQEMIAGILRSMGYKTVVSSPGPDLGKDIVASPDGLGLESPRIRVEVKHRKGSMGAPDIRSFTGGLRPGDKGLYVSTGGFSKEAHYEAERANVPVTLVDLDILVTLLVEHYEGLDAEARSLVPLKRIYWPVG